MDLHAKRVVVVGLAQTGIAVARFCATRGARVILTDSRSVDALKDRIQQVDSFAELELGGHQTETFVGADLIVVSPGVPELPPLRAARAVGIEVIAEIELAYRFLNPGAQLIAITGTNGKSTTTSLAGVLCAASDRPTFCGGNLGNHPLIEAIDHPANSPGGIIVAEVAGFMLETCTSFSPHVAVCLNVTEDHLDRYGTMDVYASMKTRIFTWQIARGFAIGNASCPWTVAGMKGSKGQKLMFSSQSEVAAGAFLSPDQQTIIVRLPGVRQESYAVRSWQLVGLHNLENAMAAILAARATGVSQEVIVRAISEFHPPAHRMQKVAQVEGVVYFDDSKGTNVAAVAASLRGFPKPAILIAGGVDKGGSYAPLFAAADGIVTGMVLIGEAQSLIRQAATVYGASYPIVDAQDMDEAVAIAKSMAQPGTAIILSPACSSYDMFANFAERGKAFQAAVRNLRTSLGKRGVSR